MSKRAHNFIDLTGQRFNRLIVLGIDEEKTIPKHIYWKCLCDCNKTISVQGNSLRSGKTQSCGCLQKEMASKANKKYCKYDLESEEYGIGWTHNGDVFWFDKEDYDKIKDYCWIKNDQGYFYARKSEGTNIKLARLIMGVLNNPNIIIDHIHGSDTLYDNRKCNLRHATLSQNGMNKVIQSNNTSGYTGVSKHKLTNKWIANIKVNNKTIYLGEFENKEDAIKVRKEAEEKYFGEFSYDNSRYK